MNQFPLQQEMLESDSILSEIFDREFETGQKNRYFLHGSTNGADLRISFIITTKHSGETLIGPWPLWRTRWFKWHRGEQKQ